MHLFMSKIDAEIAAAAATKVQLESTPSPLNTGAIIGVVIGVIAVIALISFILYYIYRLKKYKYKLHKKQNSMYKFILDPPDDDSFVERKRGSKVEVEVDHDYPSYPSNNKRQQQGQQRPKSFLKKARNRHSTKRQSTTTRSSFKPLHLSILMKPSSLTFDDLLEDPRFSKLFSKQNRDSKRSSALNSSKRESIVSLIRTPREAHCSSVSTKTNSILSYVSSVHHIPSLSHSSSDSDSTDGDDFSESSSSSPSMLITIDNFSTSINQQLKEEHHQDYRKKQEEDKYVLY